MNNKGPVTKAYEAQLEQGNKMMRTLAGATSTAFITNFTFEK